MAYMEDQAQERERLRQQMLGGQRPQAIGQEDPNAPAPQGVQLPTSSADILGAVQQFLAQALTPGKVKVDDPKPLEVPMMLPNRPSPPTPERWRGSDVDVGGALSGMFDQAKGSALQDILRRSRPETGPASVRDRSTTGAAERAQRRYDNTPGPYAKGAALTQYQQNLIPGLKPSIDASKAEPGRPAAEAYMEQQKGGGGVRGVETLTGTGDRMIPGADLKGVDPRVAEIVGAAAEGLPPGYKIQPTSGVRDVGQGQHTKGTAIDWKIIGPDGKEIANRGHDTTGLYTELARNAYGYQEKNHPDMTGTFNWGGAFGTSKANPEEPDLMHFDNGGRRGHITQYSRETIGAKLPPSPKPPGPETPAWDKGLPQQDAKTNWPQPSATTSTAELPQPQAPAAPAAPSATSATSAPQGRGVPPELSKLVMSKEWFVGTPQDDYGRKTIGYGTDARGRASITEPEARAEMNAQLQTHLDKIDANFPGLQPGVRNSVASLTFNVGDGWMSEKGNHLAAALKAGDMGAAKQAFMQYVHVHDAAGNKSVLQGLVNRRTDEARAFDGQQPLYTKNPDAPAGSQPDVATAAPVEKPQVPAAETALQTMRDREPAAAAAPSVFDKGTAAVPVSGAGGLQAGEDVPATTGATLYPDADTAAVNAIKPTPQTAADVSSKTPTAVTPAPAAPQPQALAAPPPPAPARAPAPPPASASVSPKQPAPVAQTGLDRAHALLDMKAGAFVKQYAPEHLGKVQQFGVENTPMRELVQKPFVGSQIVDGLAPAMESKFGFTRKDFDRAVTQPSPSLGKRSEALPQERATEFSSQSKTPPLTPGEIRGDRGRSGEIRGDVPLPQERPAGAPQTPQTPQVTPSIAQALEASVKDQGAPPVDMKPNPEAMPVLPATEVAPPAPGAPGGPLSLAPPGLAQPGGGPFQTAMGVPGSQGGAISMLGVLPPIQNSTFSTPLLDQQAAQPSVGQGNLSPIPWDTVGGWGWGGGPSTGIGDFGGGGFDFGGGGAGGMFSGSGGLFPMPMTWGG